MSRLGGDSTHKRDRLQSVSWDLHTIALWGTTNGGPAAHSKQDLPAIVTGGTKLGLTHAGHVRCDNQVPLGNLMRTVTERMGVKTDDAFYGGAHTGLIKEIA